jgi:hypothetical protein
LSGDKQLSLLEDPFLAVNCRRALQLPTFQHAEFMRNSTTEYNDPQPQRCLLLLQHAQLD